MKRVLSIFFALLLVVLSMLSHVNAQTKFSDVTIYAKEISFLADKKIINGYPDGTFKPSNNVTRQQVAVMIYNALDLADPTQSEIKQLLSNFKDIDENHRYAKQIAATIKSGIFSNASERFNPSVNMTREQMATVLVNAFNLKPTNEKVNFVDINKSGHKGNIEILAQNKVTQGRSDEGVRYFDPSKPVTRGHFSVFMYNALNESGGDNNQMNQPLTDEEKKRIEWSIERIRKFAKDDISSINDKINKLSEVNDKDEIERLMKQIDEIKRSTEDDIARLKDMLK